MYVETDVWCIGATKWVVWIAECILFGFGFDQKFFSLSFLAEGVGWKSPLYYVGLSCFIEFIKLW